MVVVVMMAMVARMMQVMACRGARGAPVQGTGRVVLKVLRPLWPG